MHSRPPSHRRFAILTSCKNFGQTAKSLEVANAVQCAATARMVVLELVNDLMPSSLEWNNI